MGATLHRHATVMLYNTCLAVSDLFCAVYRRDTQHQQNPDLQAMQTLSTTIWLVHRPLSYAAFQL